MKGILFLPRVEITNSTSYHITSNCRVQCIGNIILFYVGEGIMVSWREIQKWYYTLTTWSIQGRTLHCYA